MATCRSSLSAPVLMLTLLLKSGLTESRELSTVHTYSVTTEGRPGAPDARDSQNSLGQYCYQQLCWCYGDKADCSRNYGNLTFIPKIPEYILFLNFSYNAIAEIRDYTFFLNVTNIRGLDLSGNGLTYIVSGAFRLLSKLQYLSLSYNKNLNNSALPPTLSITTLVRLDFTNGDLGPLADDIFYTHPLPFLSQLHLHYNRLNGLNLSAFVPLVNLSYLGLVGNQISKNFLSDQIDSLEILVLTENSLDTFPTTCSSNGTSLFPRLVKLILRSNSISRVPADVCLPLLQRLDLSRNYFKSLSVETVHINKFPSLLVLDFDDMRTSQLKIMEGAFKHPTLQELYLDRNGIDFSSDNVDTNSFSGCPNLHRLQLSHNLFNRVSNIRWELLFANLTNLRQLFISVSKVLEIPVTFSNLKSLQMLAMSSNNVATIPDGVFDTQPNLTFLQLDDNRISVIPQSTFSPSTRQRLSHLDLSGNPFICSCDVMWFRDWLVTDPGLFQDSWTTYDCDNLPGTKVPSFFMSEQACLMSRDTARLVTVSVSLLISSVTLLTLLYRYRWHLRLVVYEAFRGPGEARRRRLQRQNFLYDLFVSYAAADLHWVRAHLMPQLEEGLGLRLCLHDRDFIPGHPIVDNIEDSVQSSKKVLMLFSSQFARSEWCQFELTLCLSHVMEHEDALLVVLLHDVPTHDLTSAMMAVLRTTTYIEWAQLLDAVASFWGRMRIALHEILPARQQRRPRDP